MIITEMRGANPDLVPGQSGQGISIGSAFGLSLEGRLERTDGACPAEEVPELPLLFETNAWVPTPRWAALTADEVATHSENGRGAEYWRAIRLLRPPGDLVDRLLTLNDRVSQQGATARIGNLDGAECSDDLEGILADWPGLVQFGPTLAMGVTTQPGGGYVTSVSDCGQRKVGLHIDAWDGRHWSGRRGCTNRISINIGEWPRHLIFSDEPVDAIYGRMGNRTGKTTTGLDLIRFLQQTRPTASYFRLRLEPGDAYVAPTENVIHDGSSLLVQGDDKQIVLRGFFAFDDVPENRGLGW